MKLLLISFFALFIIGLSPAQDLNPSIPRDRTNLDGDMLYESITIRPLAVQKWTGHVRNFFGYSNVDGEITVGKDVITQANHRGYAAFDITGIPTNAVITQINLMVYTETASISNEHTVYVKSLNVDPVAVQGETLFNSIESGVIMSDLNWKPMTTSGYHSTQLANAAVLNLQNFLNWGRTRWYIGFQEKLDNDGWGKFRGWNTPGQPEPYCVVEYTVPTYLINITPASLPFGNVQVGQYSDKTFYIYNQSNISTISGYINVSGSAFSMASAGYYYLAPGASMGFSVRFSPVSAGSCSGSVAIYHNATNLSSPFNIPLTGTGVAATFQLSVSISNGWNMVSIPGMHPVNQNVETWWTGKDPAAQVFKFAGGYVGVPTAAPGQGYWMKHSGTNLYNTGDEWPSDGILNAPHNPIAAGAGWNLIGGYEQSAATVNLTTTPPGLIAGSVFKYAGSYSPAATLEPGYGYWVKLTDAGSINIPTGPMGPMKTFPPVSTEGFGKIIITDKTGKSYVLYSAKNNTDLNQYELPPMPPQGMFDVRYSSQRYAEKLSTAQGIEMTGVQYPVKVKAEGTGIILTDETGKEIARLNAGEEVSVNTAGKLYATENVVPLEFSLAQNYPNPFNPSTTIQFSIPEDVQNVKLIIYSALGEKIAELVNTGLQAGVYKYSWNAGSYASGIYIYQLVTEKFVWTKKMILTK